MNLLQTIGRTPLVKLDALTSGLKAQVFVKLESQNPGGSVKDRAALYMINSFLESGKLKDNGTIVVPTSGNTGIGLAIICAVKGIKLVLTMPESMSQERRALLKRFGANLILTEAALGMRGAVAKAEELVTEHGYIFLDQFSDPNNAKAHYETTGPEIFKALPEFDIFVAGVGTGGTITGAGRYFKEKLPNIKLVAVEPFESAVLSGKPAGPHLIQGIGAGFVPALLDSSIVDQIIQVKGEEAISMAKQMFEHEGISCGISSGAAVQAALELAALEENAGKRIVTILPDTGERYLSTKLFN